MILLKKIVEKSVGRKVCRVEEERCGEVSEKTVVEKRRKIALWGSVGGGREVSVTSVVEKY